MSKHLFIVCTETSGDLLGGRLVHELKTMTGDLKVTGVGGDQLCAQGMQPYYQVADFNVMGLFEVLSQLKRLRAIFNDLLEKVKETRPDLILLVDAPDFNLRFARAVKGLGIPVIYYVSPQVWAWRRKRARAISGLVDHMMVLFSFEVPLYEGLGLPTTWVGHPLVDELKHLGEKETFLAKHGLDANRPLVALAPGSRKSEVIRLLPIMARIARARADRYQFAVPLAKTIEPDLARAILGDTNIPILPGIMRRLMVHADAAIVASGTATLETALLHTPMIVSYKLKTLTYLMARHLVKIPHVALVNIVLGREVVPELMQKQFCPEQAVPILDELVSPSPRRARILAEFDRLETILGGGGASRKAAEVVRGFLGS